jgi:hypothetical protein
MGNKLYVISSTLDQSDCTTLRDAKVILKREDVS